MHQDSIYIVLSTKPLAATHPNLVKDYKFKIYSGTQSNADSPSFCLINYSSGALRKYYQAVRQLCPIKMCYGCWFPTAHGHLAKSTTSN